MSFPLENRKRTLLLLGALVIGPLFFIFGLTGEARAETYEYGSDIVINSDFDGEVWSVGQLVGGSIYSGSLSFQVRGLTQDDPGSPKRQIFAMYDANQPTLWDNHGYFIHFRKRSEVPQLGSPGFQWKYCIDCDWAEDYIATDPWNPEHTYRFTFTWTSGIDNRSATVKVEDLDRPLSDDSDNYVTWESSIPLAWPFLAKQLAITFGSAGLANHLGFPAQPGAVYTDITLRADRVTDGWDDFGGYPSCDDSSDSDSGPRQDQPGTDLGDPYDDPNNPYDDCACTSLTGGEPPCEDPRAGDDKINLAQTPFSLYIDFDCDDGSCSIDVGLKENWNLGDVLNELFDDQENETPDPSLDINFAPAAATTGETVTVATIPQDFRTMTTNLMFNWCMLRGDNGLVKTYNEMLANGFGEMAEVADPKSWQNGGCCSKLTRDPANFSDSDSDNDGMGDNWERRYFVGETINGVVATNENVLELVSPSDDYDNDGYQATKFKNENDQYMTVTPALQETVNGGLGEDFYPGADGKLTNVEEYILGTNPTDGDTDNDGYGDEMDYLGVGAITFPFEIDMEPGPGSYGYLLTVSAVGINENNLVSVAGRSREYSVSEGQSIEINLHSEPGYLAPEQEYSGSEFNLEVSLLQGDVNLQDMVYEWYFNGESVCDDEMFGDFCDVGTSRITIGEATVTDLLSLPGFDGDSSNIQFGEDYEFKVVATDPVTRRSASMVLDVPVVSSLDLTTACSPEMQDNDSLPSGLNQPVPICISQLLENSESDITNANFQWSVNGKADQGNSGLGKSVYPLIVTSPKGETETVSVQVIDPGSGNLIGFGQRELTVAGPEINIVEPEPYSFSLSGNSPKMANANPGETVTFVTEIENFPATTEKTYNWSIANDSSSGIDLAEYSYDIPAEVSPGATFDVNVSVRGIDGETGNIYEDSDSLTLYIDEPEVAVGSGNLFTKGMASVLSLIPAPFRIAVQVVAIGLGIFVLLYIIFRITGPISIR